MKKIVFILLFISFSLFSYSQNPKELSEEQKDELRKSHNSALVFSSSKKETKFKTELKSTNSTEESDESVKTKVKYYYGKEDSLYKEFEYIKPN